MLVQDFKIKPNFHSYLIIGIVFISSFVVILSCHFSYFITILWVILLIIVVLEVSKQLLAKVTLKPQSENKWQIEDSHILVTEAKILGDSIVTPYFLLVRFQKSKKIYSYVVLRSSMAKKDFKTLLLLLTV